MNKVKTVRTGKLGKIDLRLVQDGSVYVGLADGNVCVQGENADDTWQKLHDEAGKANPHYFGFDGARTRFLKFFPNGFQSAGYAGQERDYKLAAKQKLDSTAPLSEAAQGSGFGEAVLSAFRATNMLSPFEKTRLQDVLRGPSADAFVRAAARFAMNPGQDAMREMETVLKPYECAKWTVVTYLPYLWKPETHMFLKPETTKDFAVRVGHAFASHYDAALKMPVYESLLDLVEKTAQELATLTPKDRIDIQSFIWVVGNYQEGSESVYA